MFERNHPDYTETTLITCSTRFNETIRIGSSWWHDRRRDGSDTKSHERQHYRVQVALLIAGYIGAVLSRDRTSDVGAPVTRSTKSLMSGRVNAK
jgi:hypothetical protein